MRNFTFYILHFTINYHWVRKDNFKMATAKSMANGQWPMAKSYLGGAR